MTPFQDEVAPSCWTARRKLAAVLAAVYFVATSLGHLAFTLWLIRPRQWFGVDFAFKEAVPALLVVGAAILAAWLLLQAQRYPELTRSLFWHWLLWCLCVVLVDRFLTYSVYEYAHYPQYALLAILLACAIDPGAQRGLAGWVLVVATGLGMVDELSQYIWITPSYGNYLDFNDFLVNEIAAAAGVMLYYGRRHTPAASEWAPSASPRKRWPIVAVVLMVGVSLVAFGLQWIAISPAQGVSVPAGGWLALAPGAGRLYLERASGWYYSWRAGPYRGSYFILGPPAAIGCMVLLTVVFWRYPRLPGPTAGWSNWLGRLARMNA